MTHFPLQEIIKILKSAHTESVTETKCLQISLRFEILRPGIKLQGTAKTNTRCLHGTWEPKIDFSDLLKTTQFSKM